MLHGVTMIEPPPLTRAGNLRQKPQPPLHNTSELGGTRAYGSFYNRKCLKSGQRLSRLWLRAIQIERLVLLESFFPFLQVRAVEPIQYGIRAANFREKTTHACGVASIMSNKSSQNKTLRLAVQIAPTPPPPRPVSPCGRQCR